MSVDMFGSLDAVFRNAHLNFGYAPGRVPTMRVEVTLSDGRWVESFFGFDATVGEVVVEMSALVNATTGVLDE